MYEYVLSAQFFDLCEARVLTPRLVVRASVRLCWFSPARSREENVPCHSRLILALRVTACLFHMTWGRVVAAADAAISVHVHTVAIIMADGWLDCAHVLLDRFR